MINVENNNRLPIEAVDNIARIVVGDDLVGVSLNTGTVIHLLDSANVSTQNKAEKIFDNWGQLTTPVNTWIVVGATDPIVVFETGDTEIGYVVLLDDGMYASGTATVTAGSAILTLVDPEVGNYKFYFTRVQGNFANGYMEIDVVEA